MEPTASAAQPMLPNKVSVLFVCMGNICRSPALAAVLQQLAMMKGVADKLDIDSSGLTTYYLGKQADLRISLAAEKKGVKIDHIAQVFETSDFQRFDYIFAVNHEVKELLTHLSSEKDRKKIFLATHFASKYKDMEVPDPFYMGPDAFDHVLEMAFDACQGILDLIFPSSSL